jgi:hypothetical protein
MCRELHTKLGFYYATQNGVILPFVSWIGCRSSNQNERFRIFGKLLADFMFFFADLQR